MLIPKQKITFLIFLIEVLALVLSFVFVILWIKHPRAHYDAYFTLTGVTFVVTELFRRYEGKIFNIEGTGRTKSEKLHHADALRPKFEAEIFRCKKENLRKDVIICHVNRADKYPEVAEGKGISSWFRVGLLATYHGGILVGRALWIVLTDSEHLTIKSVKIQDLMPCSWVRYPMIQLS